MRDDPVRLSLTQYEIAWQRMWQGLGAPKADPALLRALLARYTEPHRHYHTLRHLEACFAHFDAVRHEAIHAPEIELALWFHDAVYEIRAANNELHSADWAHDVLLGAGVDAEAAQRVHALVMATCHNTLPRTPDQQILLDVDLAILGAPTPQFDAYEAQVRAEYASVPEPAFRSGRRRILEQFLARERIFLTAHFNSRYEAQARANLRRSIRSLQDR